MKINLDLENKEIEIVGEGNLLQLMRFMENTFEKKELEEWKIKAPPNVLPFIKPNYPDIIPFHTPPGTTIPDYLLRDLFKITCGQGSRRSSNY